MLFLCDARREATGPTTSSAKPAVVLSRRLQAFGHTPPAGIIMIIDPIVAIVVFNMAGTAETGVLVIIMSGRVDASARTLGARR